MVSNLLETHLLHSEMLTIQMYLENIYLLFKAHTNLPHVQVVLSAVFVLGRKLYIKKPKVYE